MEADVLLDDLLYDSSSDSSDSSLSGLVDVSSDSSSCSNKEFEQMIENSIYTIEDAIMHFCVIYNLPRTLVDDVILELLITFKYNFFQQQLYKKKIVESKERRKSQRLVYSSKLIRKLLRNGGPLENVSVLIKLNALRSIPFQFL